MNKKIKNTKKSPLLYIVIIAVIITTIVACSGYLFPRREAEQAEAKLTITGLDEHNGLYVVALGFDAGNERLFAAEYIGTDLVFFGEEVNENTVDLSVWRKVDEETIDDYNGPGPFRFLAFVLNKHTFTKSEELTVRDYLNKGRAKPWWLAAVGEVNGISSDGEFGGSFKEILPLTRQ